jgi:erythromycin esterase
VGWAILLLVVSSTPLAAQSFLNLSFEEWSNGAPTGWYLDGSGVQYSADSSTAVDGAQSLRIASLTNDTTQDGGATEYLTAGPAIGKTLHVSGWIRTLGVSGHADLRADAWDSQGNSLAFGNLGSSAPLGTTGWTNYGFSLAVPAGSVEVSLNVNMSGAGTAWFDALSIDVDGQPYFPNPTAAQIQWIQANAIPFTTLDPNAGFTELEPLKQIIGNAHIVGLGEGTHGTSEFFRMKSRLVSFLAQEMGFTIFAMEANMPEAYLMNDYVLTGRGDPTELLKGMYFWTWNTQEVLDMVQWMRQYNASGKGIIQFLGFDMQTPGVAMDYVLRFVRQADPGLLATVNSNYSLVSALPFYGYATASNYAQYQAAQAAAQSVLDQLQANRDKYLQEMSATEVEWAIQNARVVEQAVQFEATGDTTFRDASMAANIEWIAAQAPPGARIVLWAHNLHIYKEPGAMGGALAQYFGPDYVAFGQTLHSGTYRAVGSSGGLATFPALDSFPGSAEYFFHETGTPQQILDLRLASANDPGSGWLLGGLEFRDIGAAEVDGFLEFSPTSRLVQDFDGLIFFDQTTASAELPYQAMDLAVFAPVAERHGMLGVPYVAASAPGSGTPSPLPAGTVGVPYAQTLMGGGGTCSGGWCTTFAWPPYGNWTVTAGALPPGLSLGSDGVLSGTPTKDGWFAFTVQTTENARGRAALGQLQLRIGSFGQASRSPCPMAGTTGPFATPQTSCGPPQPPWLMR